MKKALFGGLSVFLATLSLLFWQVQSGHDPVLNGPVTALVSSTSGPNAAQTRTSGGHHTATHRGHRHGPAAVRTSSSGGGHQGGERESD